MAICLPSGHGALGSVTSATKGTKHSRAPSRVRGVHACNPCTPEAKAEGSQLQGPLGLQSKFEVILGSIITSYLRQTQSIQDMKNPVWYVLCVPQHECGQSKTWGKLVLFINPGDQWGDRCRSQIALTSGFLYHVCCRVLRLLGLIRALNC